LQLKQQRKIIFAVTVFYNQSHEPEMSGIFLPQENELTITTEGNETLWDIGFTRCSMSGTEHQGKELGRWEL
jgi:hypothetical protein